ncbi:MAG: hypothetical protein Q7S17_07680 [Xanthobacteraceae bacterium]|nr:hypothetical protein [Xanthobacteraceae bacterium]
MICAMIGRVRRWLSGVYETGVTFDAEKMPDTWGSRNTATAVSRPQFSEAPALSRASPHLTAGLENVCVGGEGRPSPEPNTETAA